MNQRICIEEVKELLEKDKLKEAFVLIDGHLATLGFSTDLSPHVVAASSQLSRTEKAYRLGTISWERYDIASTKIVEKTLLLSNDICKLLSEKDGAPTLWTFLWEVLKGMIPNFSRNNKKIPIEQIPFAPETSKTKARLKVNFESLLEELATLKPIDQ